MEEKILIIKTSYETYYSKLTNERISPLNGMNDIYILQVQVLLLWLLHSYYILKSEQAIT